MSRLYEGESVMTSPFGPRVLEGDDRFHYGEDHVGLTSKNIIAPTNGRVISSQIIYDKNNLTWEWGHYIKMDDLNGYYLFFCHLSKRLVSAGQSVDKGQIIGIEGNSGYSKGSHLHFEVRRKSDGKPINPREYFKILDDWELNYFRNATQKRFGFDDNTMNFLSGHPYPNALFEKLATKK